MFSNVNSLRKGLTGEARAVYAALEAENKAGADAADVRMRLGLCAWADGDFAAALAKLRAAVASAPTERAEPTLYLALLYEQLGYYRQAREALDAFHPPAPLPEDDQTARLMRQTRARLQTRATGKAD